MFTADHDEIRKAIHRAQHCQRNWDLTQEIPKEDMDLFIESVTQCPSKQNIAHYRVHAITNRDIIEAIHNKTDGFTINFTPYRSVTNSQVLANLLLVLEPVNLDTKDDPYRNDQTRTLAPGHRKSDMTEITLERDKNMAVGIAAGYLNMTAALLGYGTGCCACFDSAGIKEILNLEKDPVLLMGIGFKDPNLNRRVHHQNHEFVFPTKLKQAIKVSYWT